MATVRTSPVFLLRRRRRPDPPVESDPNEGGEIRIGSQMSLATLTAVAVSAFVSPTWTHLSMPG
jgi:hypothetical protein